MTILQIMITLSVIMFCVQVSFCIYVEQMKWYWAIYSAVIVYSGVVVLLAVLANVEQIFPQLTR